MNRLKLHIPSENELEYRLYLIADEDTMGYNKGYGDNGGCTYRQTAETGSPVVSKLEQRQ